MLILERSVTEPYWKAHRDYINRRLSAGRWRRVGRYGVVNIQGNSEVTTYAVLRDKQPVAWLYLGKREAWHAWEVLQVWVFPEYRGEGLASKLYRAAVNGDGLLLASGETQSKSSRALWRRFIKKKMFNIWAQDFNNLESVASVSVEDDQLDCELPVYTREHGPHDIRLVAAKKG